VCSGNDHWDRPNFDQRPTGDASTNLPASVPQSDARSRWLDRGSGYERGIVRTAVHRSRCGGAADQLNLSIGANRVAVDDLKADMTNRTGDAAEIFSRLYLGESAA
jgi:hypothetical protein